MGGLDVGDPVPDSLVDGVLEGLAAAGDRADLRAEQFHAEDVEGLPLDVDFTHIDDTFHTEHGAGGSGGDPMLPGPGLGDDARLAHPFDEQGLAEGVIDFVGPGMGQILAFEVDLGSAEMFGEPFCVVKRGRTPHVMPQQFV